MRAPCLHPWSPIFAAGLAWLSSAAPPQGTELPDPVHAALVGHLADRHTRDLIDLLDQWRGATGSAKTALAAEIAAAAPERRGYLAEAMRRDPDGAWTAVLEPAERDDLDALAPGNTAQPATLTGVVTSVFSESDAFSVVAYGLAESNGNHLSLRPAHAEPRGLISGSQVQVTGFLLDDELLFDAADSALVVLQQGSATTTTAPGEKLEYLAVRADFIGAPCPLTAANIESLFNGPGGTNVDDYYQEVSFGLLAGVHATVYDLGAPMALGIAPTSNRKTIQDLVLANLEAALFPLEDYDGLAIFMDWSETGAPNFKDGTWGLAQITYLGEPLDLGIIWAGDGSLGLHGYVHEVGHNLGSGHGSFWLGETGASSFDLGLVCKYGDRVTVMGGSLNACSNDASTPGHWNGPHKLEIAGWIPASSVQHVDASTAQQFFDLAPVESGSTGLQLIEIAREPGDSLYVEFRKPSGYDTATLLGDVGIGASGAALLHTWQDGSNTLVFDPHDYLEPGPRQDNVALQVNQLFEDPCSTAKVRPVGFVEGKLRVRVLVTTDCDTTLPVAAITSPPDGAVVSGTVLLQAQVTEDDPILQVDFYRTNGETETFIGTSTGPYASNGSVYQYQLSWNTATAAKGNHALFVRVTTERNGGACCPIVADSPWSSVRVTRLSNGLPPLTSMVQPPPQSTVPVSFAVQASASDDDGVASVEYWIDPAYADLCGAGETHEGLHPPGCKYHAFFPAYSSYFGAVGGGSGAFLIGVESADPYTWNVASVPPGTYSLWSRAHDVDGQPTESAPTTITVDGQGPFAVNLEVESSTVPAGASVSLSATTTADENEVGHVDFFVDGALVCRDEEAPYACSWSVPAVPDVVYVLRTDSFGLGGRTATDTVSVTAQ